MSLGRLAHSLGLGRLELLVGDGPGGFQVGKFGELVGCARRPGCLLDIGLKGPVLLLRSFDGSLLHAAAAGDQVNQDAEHWDHYDEYDPQRFGETAHITTAENIAK